MMMINLGPSSGVPVPQDQIDLINLMTKLKDAALNGNKNACEEIANEIEALLGAHPDLKTSVPELYNSVEVLVSYGAIVQWNPREIAQAWNGGNSGVPIDGDSVIAAWFSKNQDNIKGLLQQMGNGSPSNAAILALGELFMIFISLSTDSQSGNGQNWKNFFGVPLSGGIAADILQQYAVVKAQEEGISPQIILNSLVDDLPNGSNSQVIKDLKAFQKKGDLWNNNLNQGMIDLVFQQLRQAIAEFEGV